MREIIDQTAEFVRKQLIGAVPGFDWGHIYRVWKNGIKIAEGEGGVNMDVVELSALLHNLQDWKFAEKGSARSFLSSLGVDEKTIDQVCHVLDHISFKGAKVPSGMQSKEGMIVQDADRLDAMGAMGIVRTFSYGTSINQEFHNPEIPPVQHKSFEEYKGKRSTSINHFYEKLLLLKDRMNTKTGREMAKERHAFMEQFLSQFFAEWDCV